MNAQTMKMEMNEQTIKMGMNAQTIKMEMNGLIFPFDRSVESAKVKL